MATKKDLLKQSQEAIGNFFQLANALLSDDAPYDINELSTESPFYQTAKELADEMGLDWEGMSHEDSTRLMLNLLSEYYNRIQTDDAYQPVLTITYQKAK